MLQNVLLAHPVFQSAARPKAFVRLIASRYQGWQAYGAHVDDVIMAGGWTDLSVTLFLSDPEAYQGGGLVMQDLAEDRMLCLPAAVLVPYPSDMLHREEEVTEGTRFARRLAYKLAARPAPV